MSRAAMGGALLALSCGSDGSGEGAGSGGAAGVSGAAGAGGVAGASGSGGAAAGSGGSGGAAGCDGASPFAVRVVSYEFGPGQAHGQATFPAPVLGPPRGGGCCQGSVDVTSLGLGGWVILELGDTLVDGPGPDLLVFENAFEHSGGVFAEPATVALSDDGERWFEFPCTASAPPWDSCAGVSPVYANADTNSLDPTNPEEAGGDAYDLAAVGLTQARFVKITDRADLTGTVFDLDAVAVVNGACSAR